MLARIRPSFPAEADALEASFASLDERHARGWMHQLARAYQASGQPEKARAAMSEYQELLKKTQQEKDDVAREAQIVPPQ